MRPIGAGSATPPSSSSARAARCYLAAILDLFSRFVVEWAVSAINEHHLVLNALTMALNRRYPETGLLHHSDRGSTYASEDYQSEDYQRRLDAHGITCSMISAEPPLSNFNSATWFVEPPPSMKIT
jgi:transposase InsO family protein